MRTTHLLRSLSLLAVALLSGSNALSQESSSPARYIPADSVMIYIEYDGLDAHADAWKKTAAYKILNNTSTGVMLEEVAAQVVDRFTGVDASGKNLRKGAESVALVKLFAKSGFAFAALQDSRSPTRAETVLVLRNAYKDKAARSFMARVLQDHNAVNTKPKPVERAGHKIISGVDHSSAEFGWWVEESKKEDILFVTPSIVAADLILETIDGKRPSFEMNPQRLELMKAENGFTPNGRIFFNPAMFRNNASAAKLGLDDLKKFDFRWGFQDEALMSVTRIVTSGPRKGILALFDGSTFDKQKMLPIPENVGGFTVVSMDMKGTVAKVVALAKSFQPDAEDQFNKFQELLKARTKIRLKEDLLAHLGPKVAWYVLPNKSVAPAPAAVPNMMSLMMAGAGMDQIPKLAIVADIDDPVAFGKVLDEAMISVNRELKTMGKPPATEAPAKGARNRPPATPSLEFRLVPGDTKSFVLSVPPELAGQFPPTLRPTIRVGLKQVVLATSADVARVALESKGTWTPSNDVGVAYQNLSPSLKALNVNDSRETLPVLLATFPAKVQLLVNSLLQANAKPPGAVAGAAPPPAPGAPPARFSPVASAPSSSNGGGGGAPAPGGAPGAPGAPNAAAPAGPSGNLVLQIDAAKLPSADSIKALLFPSLFTVESSTDEIRFVTRNALPLLDTPAVSSVAVALIVPGVQGARKAAREAMAKQQGVIPPAVPGAPGAIK